jgi:hypothetical protein
MTPRFRQFALTVHVTFSVGWIGAVAAFLALDVPGLTSEDAQMVRAVYLAMDLTIRFVVVPLALASLLTGLAQALGTPWGLFRHYWVLVKFLLTVVDAIILLNYMQTAGVIAGRAADPTFSSDDFLARRTPFAVLHAGGGLLVLLVAATLGVYKPRGMTPYGRRKQREQGDTGVVQESTTSTPSWVKAVGIIALVLVLLVVIRRFTGVGGPHGPSRHIPSGDVGGYTPSGGGLGGY